MNRPQVDAAALLHITTADAWHRSSGDYRDPSLESEGFIHASTPEQVHIPANDRFGKRTDLVLLVIDPNLLTSRVVFEDCYDTGMSFPHIYGPIDRHAVISIEPYNAGPNGRFARPDLQTPPAAC